MLLLAVCAPFMPACAAGVAENTTVADGETDRLFNLDDVVVTGTRTPKLLKDVPILTRLITEEEIRKTDATNIQDLLQQVMPGVEFTYAMNQQVNMNLSGFAGQNVLILLNGERLAGETMENTDFARLNMQNVQRIEIIKGAASALYGSNAAGGVINIITKEVDKPWTLNLNARLADHKEQRYGGSLGLRKGGFSNMIDVTHTKIDTYNLCYNTKDDCDFRTVFGGRTWNVNDRLAYSLNENMKLSAHAGYYFKERLYNVDAPDRYRDFSGGVKGEWRISDRDNVEVSYNFDQYDKSDYLVMRDLDVRDYRNVQHTMRMLYSHRFAEDGVLTLGGDYMRDYLDSYQFADGAKRQHSGDVFAQYDHNFSEHWELVTAGRLDYFSDNDDLDFTSKIGMRYRSGDLTVRTGYAGGFRSPTLKERYMRYDMSGIFWIHGNEELKSEYSHTFSASAEYTWRRYYFTVAASHSIVRNKISTSTPMTLAEDPAYHYVRYINLENLRVSGVEATAQGKWLMADASLLGARLSYCYTHEEVKGNDVNQYCPARPHALNVSVDWDKQWCGWYGSNISLTGRVLSAVDYTGMMLDAPFTEYEIHNPAYTIWKVQLTNRFRDGLRLNIAVDNIFNYAPRTYYFNSPVTLGVNLMVGVSVDLDKWL